MLKPASKVEGPREAHPARATLRPDVDRRGRGTAPLTGRADAKPPECPCVILRLALVFENKATVGCVACGLNLKGVMSAAVEFERALLTARQLRNHILCIFIHEVKPNLALSGGVS